MNGWEPVHVFVPFTSGSWARNSNYDRVLKYYLRHFPQWELTTATWPQPFTRGVALNRAIDALLSQTTIVVVNDADTLVHPDQLTRAVRMAAAAPGLVQPFTEFVWLTEHGAIDHIIPSRSQCVGVFSAETWRLGGPYNEDFQGWGFEDLELNFRWGKTWPTRQVEGRVFHHWHPRMEGQDLQRDERNRRLYFELIGEQWQPHGT